MSRRSGLEYNPIWKKENPMAEMQSDVQFDHEIQSGSLSFMQFSLQWRLPTMWFICFQTPNFRNAKL